MNNKFLAIILSIVAVVLILYQFVLKSDKPKVKRNVNTVVQNNNLDNPGGNPLGNNPSLNNNSNSNIMENQSLSSTNQMQMTNQRSNVKKDELIDFNSEILLDRVYENQLEKPEKKELPESIGIPIFVKEIYSQQDKPENKGEIKEVVFKLNAIIIKQEGSYAIINKQIVKIGDMILGAIVKDIKKSKVLLEFKGKEIILSTNSKIKKIRYLGGTSEK